MTINAVDPQQGSRPARPVLGGMALIDGVFIRSNRAWAIAHADGSVESGEIKVSRLARVPIVRVAYGIIQGLLVGLLRRRPSSYRFVVMLVLLWLIGSFEARLFVGEPGFIVAWTLMLSALVLMRLVMPARLWRFHGAEHKAIAAYEHLGRAADASEAASVSRIHDRCGTNAVFLVMLFAPLIAGNGLILPAVLLAAELIKFAVTKYPRSPFTRLLVAGGRLLQRTVTTLEPTREELAVGCRAVEACLARQSAVVIPQ